MGGCPDEVHWHPFALRAAGHYDGPRLLGFLGAHAVPGLESWDGLTYRRAVTVPSAAWAVAELRATPRGITGRVGVPVDRDARSAVVEETTERLRHLLALDRDDGPAERALADDPMLGPLLAARPGLRLPGSTDPTQELVRTVIGQQVSVAGARTVTGRVVAALGARLPAPVAAQTGLTRSWPTADALAGAPAEALPMPLARARAVRAVAAAVADGRVRWPAPDGCDTGRDTCCDTGTDTDTDTDTGSALRTDLLALPGVGPWTADYTLIRALRHPDVFLPGDLAARRQVASLGGPADPAGVAALAARWSPYRSTALAHLWAEYLAF